MARSPVTGTIPILDGRENAPLSRCSVPIYFTVERRRPINGGLFGIHGTFTLAVHS
jgi:hypothetical protein